MMQQQPKRDWDGYAAWGLVAAVAIFIVFVFLAPKTDTVSPVAAAPAPAAAPARPAQVQPPAIATPTIDLENDPFILSLHGDLDYASGGCFIKGNISASGEKIYHLPIGEFYTATVISPEAGERWFCEEEHALRNGWRPSQR